MSTKNLTLLVVVVFILLLGGCGCNGYNNMVKLDETVKSQWGNVQSEYQRRTDLIPNLVSTVKGAANFEQQTPIWSFSSKSQRTNQNKKLKILEKALRF